MPQALRRIIKLNKMAIMKKIKLEKKMMIMIRMIIMTMKGMMTAIMIRVLDIKKPDIENKPANKKCQALQEIW
jgi:hypothetical protein